MKKNYALTIIFLAILISCSSKKAKFINYLNPKIKYSGRIDTTNLKSADLYWSGTSIKVNFEGKSIKALLKGEAGDNYYNVIVDDDSIHILKPDTTKTYYQLASGLEAGKHSIEIYKRTEWDRGKTSFYGFEIDGNSRLLEKDHSKRKIEFYGNSITAGYAVEDFSGKDSPDSTYTNNYLSYAAVTSRHYNAESRYICKSGIGITISWFPITMPQLYDRLNPNDSNSKWDFSLYTPDIVVINLFQNDSWLVNKPNRLEFKENFGDDVPNDQYFIDAYQQFVSNIRRHYPETNIICILGNMDATRKDSKWVGYVQKAVDNLEDDKIFTHFIPFKETSGHPSIKEQEQLAHSLIGFIDKHIDW